MTLDSNLPCDLACPSLLELTLIRGGSSLVHAFFNVWFSSSIFTISRTNFSLWNLTRAYIAFKWNPHNLIARWFRSPDRFFRLLDDSSAIVCGPSVYQFFERSVYSAGTLDVCVNGKGYSMILQFLGQESYRFRRDDVASTSVLRPDPAAGVLVHSFLFQRGSGSVAVHVVRGDPLNFIINYATSKQCSYA